MAYSLTLKRSRNKGLNLKTSHRGEIDEGRLDSKAKGSPQHCYEKYMTLARESMVSGDRIAAEGYYQHAEHYLRLINETKLITLDECPADNEEVADELLSLDNEALIATQTSNIA